MDGCYSSVPGTPHKNTRASRNPERENQLFLSRLLTSSCRLFILCVMMANIRRMASRRSFGEIMLSMASWAFRSNGSTARIPQDQAGPLRLLCKTKGSTKLAPTIQACSPQMVFCLPTDTWTRIKCRLLFEVYHAIHSALKTQSLRPRHTLKCEETHKRKNVSREAACTGRRYGLVTLVLSKL